MDTTQVAAFVAAGTGLVGAIAGLANLGISVLRNRPVLKVFAREWAADRHGHERYIEVVAVNAKSRQNSVVEMGLWLQGERRSWKVNDGSVNAELPVALEDGQVATMAWMREELGQEFGEGDAVIDSCFAVDGYGREVRGTPPR